MSEDFWRALKYCGWQVLNVLLPTGVAARVLSVRREPHLAERAFAVPILMFAAPARLASSVELRVLSRSCNIRCRNVVGSHGYEGNGTRVSRHPDLTAYLVPFTQRTAIGDWTGRSRD